MKKQLSLFLITVLLSSCAYLTPHKRSIEQGNLFTDQQVKALHIGMTENEVKRTMGAEPVMTNIFTPSEMVYVYTIQPGGQAMTQKQVICTFRHGRLSNITVQ